MPPGRPPKRPSEAGDTPLDNGSQPKMKLPRLERSTEDFSSVVKTKLSQYTRTGQACDRCKVLMPHPVALADGACQTGIAFP